MPTVGLEPHLLDRFHHGWDLPTGRRNEHHGLRTVSGFALASSLRPIEVDARVHRAVDRPPRRIENPEGDFRELRHETTLRRKPNSCRPCGSVRKALTARR